MKVNYCENNTEGRSKAMSSHGERRDCEITLLGKYLTREFIQTKWLNVYQKKRVITHVDDLEVTFIQQSCLLFSGFRSIE